jgi:predicted nucleotidyltransferase
MKTNNIKNRIKEYFFLNPTTKLRVRQIEREVKVPLPSAIRYSKELKKEGILKSQEIAGIKLYSADRISKNFLLEKRLHNLKIIYFSGIIEHLKKELSNPPIILFGSFEKGEDIETSDIDLYIETNLKIPKLDKFEKLLNRKIQVFKHKKIKGITNPHLANNIINGTTLNNFVEVFK